MVLAEALKQLWIAKVGDGDRLPQDYQWNLWLNLYGPHAAQAIIRTSRKQHGMLKYNSTVMSPRDLWRYTDATARSMARDAGYTSPEQPQQLDPTRYKVEQLPMGYIPRKATSDTFAAPPEWLEADDVTRYQPAEWE